MKNEQSLDEIVKKVFPTQKGLNTVDTDRIMLRRNIWLKGAKYVEETMFSKEDLISFAYFYFAEEFNSTMQTSKSTDEILQEWLKKFKPKEQ
jgi:hypothetical protein